MKIDFSVIVKNPGEHAKEHFRLVRDCGINMVGNIPVYAAVAEITRSRTSKDNYSDATERARAHRLAACWNACLGMEDPEREIAALKAKNTPKSVIKPS